jgi:rhodanese-related sulfurtransferase
MTTPMTVEQLHPRLEKLLIIDVRSPGEYAGGHIPGAHNVPLDQLRQALPVLRAAADRGEIAVVCASGARSASACEKLSAAGIPAATLIGGTNAWTAAGHPLDRPSGAQTIWPMDRQVRLAAGSLVVLGLVADLILPGARWFSAAIGAGLVFSAASNTCGMAAALGRLPYNRPRNGTADLAHTLATHN